MQERGAGSPPARVYWILGAANVVAVAALVLMNYVVNEPARRAIERMLGSQGLGWRDADLIAMMTWALVALLELWAAMWLVYRALLPRVWPGVKAWLGEKDEWSREDVVILLLLIIIVLLITKGA